MRSWRNTWNPFAKKYVGALPDRPVPKCPRCGYPTKGWPPETVGLTYAGCPRCGKLFNRWDVPHVQATPKAYCPLLGG